MKSTILKISTLSLALMFLIGCSCSNGIKFLKITTDNKSVTLSKAADKVIIDKFINSTDTHEFRKLILEQSNGDKLVVEQKDKDGYLVYLTIKYEHFIIEKQPKNITEINEIMKNYLLQKDNIMSTIKFY